MPVCSVGSLSLSLYTHLLFLFCFLFLLALLYQPHMSLSASQLSRGRHILHGSMPSHCRKGVWCAQWAICPMLGRGWQFSLGCGRGRILHRVPLALLIRVNDHSPAFWLGPRVFCLYTPQWTCDLRSVLVGRLPPCKAYTQNVELRLEGVSTWPTTTATSGMVLCRSVIAVILII